MLGDGRLAHGRQCARPAAAADRTGVASRRREADTTEVLAMADLIITSPSNPRLKSLAGLRRRRTREETGQTLIEGYEELTLALGAGVRPEALYYCPELMLDAASQTRVVDQARRDGVETVQVSRTAFERAAYREGPDGFIAVVPSVVRRVRRADRRARAR